MKRSGLPKLDDLIERLLRSDWHLVDNGKHYKLKAPNGKIVTMSRSSSDRRAAENAYHILKRVARSAGVDV